MKRGNIFRTGGINSGTTSLASTMAQSRLRKKSCLLMSSSALEPSLLRGSRSSSEEISRLLSPRIDQGYLHQILGVTIKLYYDQIKLNRQSRP